MTPLLAPRAHEDFSDEVRAHLEHETERLIEEGMAPDAARAAARKAFGNVLAAEERFYESSRWMWLEQLVQDVRYGWRGLRHSPAFVLTTVLTLAVGLGLLTVAFTVFNAYVLRPVRRRAIPPASIASAGARGRAAGRASAGATTRSSASARDLFDAVVAEHTRFVSSNGRTLSAAFVSANYFEALAPRFRSAGRSAGSMRDAAIVGARATRRGRGSSRATPACSAATSISTAAPSRSSVSLRPGVHRPRRLAARRLSGPDVAIAPSACTITARLRRPE